MTLRRLGHRPTMQVLPLRPRTLLIAAIVAVAALHLFVHGPQRPANERGPRASLPGQGGARDGEVTPTRARGRQTDEALNESAAAALIPWQPVPPTLAFDCGSTLADAAQRAVECGPSTAMGAPLVVRNVLYVRRISHNDVGVAVDDGEDVEATNNFADGPQFSGGAAETDMPARDAKLLPNIAVDRFVLLKGSFDPALLTPPAVTSPRSPRRRRSRARPVAQPRLMDGAQPPHDESEATGDDASNATRAPPKGRRWAPPKERLTEAPQVNESVRAAAAARAEAVAAAALFPAQPPPLTTRDIVEVQATRFVRLRRRMNVHARLGVVIGLSTCLANFWHGNVEFTLPLFSLLRRYNALPRSRVASDSSSRSPEAPSAFAAPDELEVPLVVFVRAPSRRQWGRANVGCPSLNQFPYGAMTAAGWMLRALFGITSQFVAPEGSDISRSPLIFFDERGEHRKYLQWAAVEPTNVSVAVDNLVLDDITGIPRREQPADEDGADEGSVDRVVGARQQRDVSHPVHCFGGPVAPFPPFPERYPFLRDPHSIGNVRCMRELQAARLFFLRAAGIEPLSALGKRTADSVVMGEDVVPREEAECPTVVVVDRQGSGNGRDILNSEEVVESLRAALPACATLTVTRLSAAGDATAQLRLLRNATIVVAVRGAAALNVMFLRPGSGFLSISPGLFSLPISTARDNFPWYPLPTVRADVPTAIAVCTARTPYGSGAKENPYIRMCLHRSINFCNMQCGSAHIRRSMQALLQSLREWHRATRDAGLLDAFSRNSPPTASELAALRRLRIVTYPRVVKLAEDGTVMYHHEEAAS